MTAHPLDRPIWASLTGRQAPLALAEGRALRFDPAYAMFAAVADTSGASLEGLAALIRAHGEAALVERDEAPAIPGAVVASRAICVQMTAEAITPGPAPDFAVEPIGEAEAGEMLALATLTRPGPFFARTHRLGAFIGVKQDGRLVAMAGERMQPHGFAEVSGVCTHPDHRGRGYAAALSRIVANRILARGEQPFLHAYATNAGAIGLYETLGFSIRRELVMTVLAPA
ncbi:MAG: GNAT family N-acetyltransferase [Phenylobacterium sp.]